VTSNIRGVRQTRSFPARSPAGHSHGPIQRDGLQNAEPVPGELIWWQVLNQCNIVTFSSPGRASESGVRRRAEFYYQQLDALCLLRQEVRRDLLREVKKHKAYTSYHGDIVVGPCGMCGAFHCSRPAWVANTNVRLPDDPIHCAVCTEKIAVNGDTTFLPFLIMPDGLAVHESCCRREPLLFDKKNPNGRVN
jgi:hypothetical protein